VFAKAFGAAFGLNFIAELGDKTQVGILTLSARYGFAPVFVGAALAILALNALAVTAGALIARYVPETVVRYLAAALFITSLIGALVDEGLGRVIPFKRVRVASGIVFIILGTLIAFGIL
jgi:putative Ca2+/H+ antiporter (TMEM165/GDT1 family)